MHYFAASDNKELVSLSGQIESFATAQLRLLRIDGSIRLSMNSPKKLLGPGTGRSTRPMIDPIYAKHRDVTSLTSLSIWPPVRNSAG
jgi:hypothetical protein